MKGENMKLILRADDLGFSEGVNYGIEKAVKDGLITSVGIMSNMDAANHGYQLIKDCDIALGLHTNICAGKPVSNSNLIPSLVSDNGEFCSSKEIRSRTYDSVDLKECEIEVEAQLLRFKELTGRYPDYIEGHAVSSQNFFKALENIANKYNLFFENPLLDKQWEKNNDLYGVPFAKFDEKGLYDPKTYMNDNLSFIRDNPCTIMIFHPGYLDQYILTHSTFTLIRAMECDFLCSKWLKDWVRDNNIQLVSLKNYKEK